MKYKAYKSILRIKLISGLQYRVSAWAGIAINILWGLIEVLILILFYKLGSYKNASMSMSQAITYTWLAQCFISLVPMQQDGEVYQKITSGDFAYELCRPLDLYTHWYMRAAAIRISNTLLKSGIAIIICVLLPSPYCMQSPASSYALMGSILSLIGALLLSCSFANLMNVLMLNIELGPGLNNLLVAIVTIFSGMLVPLALFPNWMQSLLRTLPFAGLMDFPCALYTGVMPTSQLWISLLKQLLWTTLLIILGRIGLSKGLKKTVIQGG
jgi:ABC-2 type transport system permease protein